MSLVSDQYMARWKQKPIAFLHQWLPENMCKKNSIFNSNKNINHLGVNLAGNLQDLHKTLQSY